jgi:hypothetical protein
MKVAAQADFERETSQMGIRCVSENLSLFWGRMGAFRRGGVYGNLTRKIPYFRVFWLPNVRTDGTWDNSVGIATGYGLDDLMVGVRFPAGVGILLFDTVSRPVLGPKQLPFQSVPGALSLGVKRPGREADHARPSSAEVKNAWSYTSTSPIRLHGVVLS